MLSVIIPHYNQAQLLRICLESLMAQEDVGQPFEIIVVDNGSSDLPTDVVAEFPDVALLVEPTPGPGPARNTGVAAAKGESFVFVDADCRVSPNYLAEATKALSDPSIQIAGSDCRVIIADPERPTAIEAFEAEFSYRNDLYIGKDGWCASGCMAVRSSAMEDVGAFRGLEVAEDRDWGLRAKAKGYRPVFFPEFIIFHPARESYAEYIRKWDRQIAHQFTEYTERRFGRLKWAARAVAIGGSSLLSLPRVLRSRRIPGGARGKLLASWVLIRQRLYRAGRMAILTVSPDSKALAERWRG